MDDTGVKVPVGVRELSGQEVIDILWPLNDMFRARLSVLARLSYDPSFEDEADQIIIAWSKSEPTAVEASDGAWRVLLERHQQLLIVAMANAARGNPVTAIPEGLSPQEQLVGVALLLLRGMRLPYPPRDLSQLTLPAARSPQHDWRPN